LRVGFPQRPGASQLVGKADDLYLFASRGTGRRQARADAAGVAQSLEPFSCQLQGVVIDALTPDENQKRPY
jgi:hypothetical protein